MRDRVEIPSGLVLRRWTGGDAASVLAAFADPLIRTQSVTPVDTPSAAERWIAQRAARWADGTAFAFAVVDGADTVLGQVSVGPVDPRHANGWVSYWTVPAARGRGTASRACRALAHWAFAELGLFRLELGHRVDNSASCTVARAAGFVVEGLERQKLAYDGVRYDVETHARLVTDPEPAPG